MPRVEDFADRAGLGCHRGDTPSRRELATVAKACANDGFLVGYRDVEIIGWPQRQGGGEPSWSLSILPTLIWLTTRSSSKGTSSAPCTSPTAR